MSNASHTTRHHLGSAHCVRAKPMGAPYNCGTHARARVPLHPSPRSISQQKAVCSCPKGSAGPFLEPLRANEPLGIEVDAELMGKSFRLALRCPETLRPTFDSVVDELRDCAMSLGPGAAVGSSR